MPSKMIADRRIGLAKLTTSTTILPPPVCLQFEH